MNAYVTSPSFSKMHRPVARPSWRARIGAPDTWRPSHRHVVSLAIAATVCVMGVRGWRAADLSGIDEAHRALAAMRTRHADARRSLTNLPALRHEAARLAATGAPPPARWTSADDVRVVAQLASQSGMTLLALEPGAATGRGLDAMRDVQIKAQTTFTQLMSWLQRLSSQPVLIVPQTLTIRRLPDALAFSATLRVYSGLTPLPAVSADILTDALAEERLADESEAEEIVLYDPFAPSPASPRGDETSEHAAWRLIGLLRDRARGLALLDSDDGAISVTTGQRLGAERLLRVEADRIALAGRGGERTLSLDAKGGV